MSDSQDLNSPVSSSKLVPAAAPTVSAWGIKPVITEPVAPAQIKKEEWPTVNVVLEKESTITTGPKEIVKEKAKSAPSKAKSGKEKWVPYEATIILPTGNNANQQQKKKGNNNNNNNNGNTNGNQKKKQGQSTNNQNTGKQKKDGQGQKNNQNGQKKQNDGSNGNQNNNQQKKKNNGQTNGSNKSTKAVAEGVASLNLKNDKANQKSRELTVESSSITSPSPTTTPAVTVTTPKNQHAELDVASPTGNDDASPVTIAPSMSAATESTDATSPITQHVKPQKQNKKQQPHPYQQQYQPQPQPQHHQQLPQPPQFQPQPNQHRNSEPFAGGNGNFYNNNPGNRGRKNNKQFNNTRHSVAGTGYNMPYYNYGGYIPIMNPNQYGYAPPFNSFAKPTDSRSHSQSPTKADLTATLNPAIPNVPGIAPFAPQPMMFNPYATETDPLTAVVNQLTYYFSNENLIKDFYLRRQMNSHGYVPLKKLIQFNRLQHLTGGDYDMMLTALKRAPSLEVHNEKVRVINTWVNWVLPYDSRDETGKVEEETEVNNENQA